MSDDPTADANAARAPGQPIFALKRHTHPETDVSALTADLAGKAAATHTHVESDVSSLLADLAALPKGRIASSGTQNTSTGAITTTELAYGAINSVAVTTVNGRRYMITFTIYVVSTVGGDTVQVRIRDGGASAPTNASTLLYEANHTCSSTNAEPVSVAFEWLPGATVTHNLGIFAVRNAGTGTITIGSSGSGRLNDLIIEDIGT